MRVTLVNQFYKPDLSPTAQLSASLAEHLASLGHQITVVAGRGGYVGDRADADDDTAGVTVRRVWTPRLGKKTVVHRLLDYAAFYAGAVLKLAVLRRQDVVVSLTTPPLIALAGVVHKTLHPSSKLVLWNMDCYPEAAESVGAVKPGGAAASAVRRINRLIFKRLDHLVVLDGAMGDLLAAYAPQNRPLPTTTIPNWERSSTFDTAAEERWEGIDALGIQDRFTVLYGGNMGTGHRFEEALDAAQRLADRGVLFVFLGAGVRFDETRARAQERKLTNCEFSGYVDKRMLAGINRAADLALITLRNEARGVMSPSKLHGNLACGLPIAYVGPEGTNVDEAIQRFGCGQRVPPGDSDALVAFIERCIDDPGHHQSMRAKARRAFDEEYHDGVTLPRFTQLLETLTGSPRKTPAERGDEHARAAGSDDPSPAEHAEPGSARYAANPVVNPAANPAVNGGEPTA